MAHFGLMIKYMMFGAKKGQRDNGEAALNTTI